MKKLISLALCAIMVVACVATLASCSSKKYIGVQSGTTGQYFVDGDEEWGFDGLEGYEAKGYNNAGLAVKDLKSGAVKYVITDAAPAKELAKAIDGVKVIDIALTEEEYAFGVDKNQAELLASINNVLSENKAEIDAIFAKYANDGEVTPVTSATKDLSKADSQLVVATNAEFAPFEYVDGDKYVGIDIEIMKLVADKLGLELVIENMDFDAVVTSVGKNGVDVAAAALTVNDKRKESVSFTNSYYNAAQVVITLANDTSFDNCKTADDVIKVICGK
ncbi:MAG: transporter substrate-binding domain-containing protein [Eubacteriales bacterium]|nr:transporter substrate-binding domain-containing protein [Eubacteriales bacterium]